MSLANSLGEEEEESGWGKWKEERGDDFPMSTWSDEVGSNKLWSPHTLDGAGCVGAAPVQLGLQVVAAAVRPGRVRAPAAEDQRWATGGHQGRGPRKGDEVGPREALAKGLLRGRPPTAGSGARAERARTRGRSTRAHTIAHKRVHDLGMTSKVSVQPPAKGTR